MDTRPFMSALSMELSSKQEVQVEAMSPEQLQHLLTFMIVLTTVSFLLVFVMVAALVIFMCFARPRSSRGCQCSAHGKMETGDLQTRHPTSFSRTNNNTVLIGGNTVPGQFLGQIMTIGPPAGSVQVTAGPKLTPIPPPKMNHGQLVAAEVPDYLGQGLGPQGAVLGPSVCSVPSRVLQGAAQVNSRVQVNPGYCPETETDCSPDITSEPIYEEIGAVVTCPESNSKVLDHQKVADLSASAARSDNGPDKSGSSVEYWHITAKEIVKFRPCTETFIERP